MSIQCRLNVASISSQCRVHVASILARCAHTLIQGPERAPSPSRRAKGANNTLDTRADPETQSAAGNRSTPPEALSGHLGEPGIPRVPPQGPPSAQDTRRLAPQPASTQDTKANPAHVVSSKSAWACAALRAFFSPCVSFLRRVCASTTRTVVFATAGHLDLHPVFHHDPHDCRCLPIVEMFHLFRQADDGLAFLEHVLVGAGVDAGSSRSNIATLFPLIPRCVLAFLLVLLRLRHPRQTTTSPPIL